MKVYQFSIFCIPFQFFVAFHPQKIGLKAIISFQLTFGMVLYRIPLSLLAKLELSSSTYNKLFLGRNPSSTSSSGWVISSVIPKLIDLWGTFIGYSSYRPFQTNNETYISSYEYPFIFWRLLCNRCIIALFNSVSLVLVLSYAMTAFHVRKMLLSFYYSIQFI